MIGKRLKELRMKRGFSQQELGTAIGVTKVSICGYENGTRLPTLDNLVKISEVLETTADYLLGREYPL
jgi:transcriptional regulator with XRE-family HTH domain